MEYYISISERFYESFKINNSKSDFKSYEYDTIDLEDESRIKLETSFAGSIRYINTDKFEQANLNCNFGSMKVYFDNAILHNGKGLVRIEIIYI